jgi:AcrR family transcriptional regulator
MSTGQEKIKGINRFQQRRERTARELVDAARSVLGRKGYHGTKVVDIARAAKVGVGTFYLYYPTKEAVFVELVEDAVARLKAELDKVSAGTPDPAQRTRQRTEAFFRFAQSNRELFRIVFGHDASFHDIVRRSQELFVNDIVANLSAGMESGAFRRGNPQVWAQAHIGMALQVVSWWIEQEDVPIDEVITLLHDLALHGVSNQATVSEPD